MTNKLWIADIVLDMEIVKAYFHIKMNYVIYRSQVILFFNGIIKPC